MNDCSNIIIYAGPSVYGLDQELLNQFDVRDPVVCGDIFRAIEQEPKAIAIIDGMFGDIRSVWHKEILYALEKNIPVYGAASLGALRAAECHKFGMAGVGEIFMDYLMGCRVSDGDVAVLHAPKELQYQPVTISLADAEICIRRLQFLLGANLAKKLNYQARKCPYQERTWQKIIADADLNRNEGMKVHSLLEEFGQSQKQLDAQLLLQTLFEGIPRLVKKDWDLQPTIFSELERENSLSNTN